MADPTVFPARATVERRDRTHARVTVPFAGELAMSLRRRATALLRQQAVDGQRIRAVAIALEPGYLVVTVAGSEAAIDEWISAGKLARAAAMAITEAYDDARRQAEAPTRIARLHARPPTPAPPTRLVRRWPRKELP